MSYLSDIFSVATAYTLLPTKEVPMTQAEKDQLLLDAVKDEDIQQVREAIGLGANVKSAPRLTASILHIAVRTGNLPITKLLIRFKADINATGAGETPLHIAIEMNHVALAKLLIDSKVDTTLLNVNGDDAFAVACESNNEEIKKLFR